MSSLGYTGPNTSSQQNETGLIDELLAYSCLPRFHHAYDSLTLKLRELLILSSKTATATAGSDVVQSGCPIFDDFFQHLWPYIGNNTANVVFQMVKRLLLIRIDQ
ncbi:hypothetical protein TNCV_922271 [Trichonephila clavipes]|nr:hypothetical protein TNCV_922271 [Trichonephila clavipes]